MKRIVGIGLLLLAAACAQLPQQPTSAAAQALWRMHIAYLNKLETWRVNGRIVIQSEEENWNANVYWRQQGSSYQLRFNTPVGQGAMLLQGSPYHVTLRTADNQTFTADNPDKLIVEVLQLEIPVTGLLYWIRGIPAPHSQPTRYHVNEKGYLDTLRQDGWDIEYAGYTEKQGMSLPNKLYLENTRFRVRIAISQWDMNF